MSFIVILIALAVLVLAGLVIAMLMSRRWRASMHRTPHARVRPESLLADLDDTQGRTEAAARHWRLKAKRMGGVRAGARGRYARADAFRGSSS